MSDQLRALLDACRLFVIAYPNHTAAPALLRRIGDEMALLSQPPAPAGEAYRVVEYGLEAADGYLKGVTPDRNTMTDAECEAAESHIAESVTAAIAHLPALRPQQGEVDVCQRDALVRIRDMKNQDGEEIDMHRDELRAIARTALREAL